MTRARDQLPYLRAVVPGPDSSPAEALGGAVGWTVVTGFPAWWLTHWTFSNAHDWADCFLYVVLTAAGVVWTGESWYIAVRALRRERPAWFRWPLRGRRRADTVGTVGELSR